MTREHYVPDRDSPIGYAFPYVKERPEDKPTVEVDIDARNMRDGLVSAVVTALELWNPVFDHWEGNRPIFRGKHADKVLKFKDDVTRYARNHSVEEAKIAYLRIAAKYVHIRPKTGPGSTLRGQNFPELPHYDLTGYTRDVIRPVVRRSDPEWDKETIRLARRAYLKDDEERVNQIVRKLLREYDANRGTAFALTYDQELTTLIRDDAPPWEYWRLVSFYVQDICDSDYPEWDPEQGLDSPRPRRARAPLST